MTWRKVKLGDFLRRIKNLVEIENDETYKLVTVRLYHKGVVLRKEVLGKELSSSAMHQVSAGEFILSGIDARHGAFGIVPQELSGAVVSNDFWCLGFDENVIDKHFFLKLTSTAFFDDLCKKASDGTTNRVRLQADKFFNIEILLPSLEEQKQLFEQFQKVEPGSKRLTTELDHQLELVRQLRQAFLREAMQGKLVAQDVSDEPAVMLLQKIKAEKEKLIAEKKLKRDKPLPTINPEEVPFEIPDNWVWCRLGEICTKIGSGSTPNGSNYSKNGVPFFRSQNVYDEGLILDDITFISDEVHKKMSGTVVMAKDILLNITGGSLGRCALVPDDFEEGNVSQHVCIVRPISVAPSFLHEVMLSPYFQGLIFDSTTGAGREGLPKYNLEQFLTPLPPLAEQKRIVAKLETLLAFCDELEARIRESKAHAESLLQVALKEALQV